MYNITSSCVELLTSTSATEAWTLTIVRNHVVSISILSRALAGGSLLETKTRPFYAWDLVTVAQLVHPELFTTFEVDCEIIVEGPSQGRTARTEKGQ